MSTEKKKSSPTWRDVKAKLAEDDRGSLIALVHELYLASKDNRTFLHTRFAPGGDVLKSYKATIDRWLWPDVSRNQDTSVAKAKNAIADYRRASGQADGLAELMVFYCERAAGFINDIGLEDEAYFNALVRMYQQALKTIVDLPDGPRLAFVTRLEEVRRISYNFGYGVGDEIDELLSEHGVDG
ncbi:hypothetical protein ACI48D_24825 [Massilia sp. LXY-6]|uniref:hypothetical protein n=1 Tax=Massilia sp. LXY-6 TaxID=3379823 RepID=UPI003EE2A776